MNADARVLSSLYSKQTRYEKSLEQMNNEIPYINGDEESARFFERINDDKSALVTNHALSTTYVSYKHETAKSAINVV